MGDTRIATIMFFLALISICVTFLQATAGLDAPVLRVAFACGAKKEFTGEELEALVKKSHLFEGLASKGSNQEYVSIPCKEYEFDKWRSFHAAKETVSVEERVLLEYDHNILILILTSERVCANKKTAPMPFIPMSAETFRRASEEEQEIYASVWRATFNPTFYGAPHYSKAPDFIKYKNLSRCSQRKKWRCCKNFIHWFGEMPNGGMYCHIQAGKITGDWTDRWGVFEEKSKIPDCHIRNTDERFLLVRGTHGMVAVEKIYGNGITLKEMGAKKEVWLPLPKLNELLKEYSLESCSKAGGKFWLVFSAEKRVSKYFKFIFVSQEDFQKWTAKEVTLPHNNVRYFVGCGRTVYGVGAKCSESSSCFLYSLKTKEIYHNISADVATTFDDQFLACTQETKYFCKNKNKFINSALVLIFRDGDKAPQTIDISHMKREGATYEREYRVFYFDKEKTRYSLSSGR